MGILCLLPLRSYGDVSSEAGTLSFLLCSLPQQADRTRQLLVPPPQLHTCQGHGWLAIHVWALTRPLGRWKICANTGPTCSNFPHTFYDFIIWKVNVYVFHNSIHLFTYWLRAREEVRGKLSFKGWFLSFRYVGPRAWNSGFQSGWQVCPPLCHLANPEAKTDFRNN